MSILIWIAFGAIVGWLASLIMKTDEDQGVIANIMIGIIGAFLGGAISRLIGGAPVGGFSLANLLMAVIGAVVLLFFIKILSGDKSTGAYR